MSEKKYVGSEALIRIIAQLKAGFASLTHTHKLEDITDYEVDGVLSDTSTNPVQNKAIKSEFDAMEAAIDGKANSSHTHTIANVTNLQSTLDAKVPTSRTVNGKALSASITLSAGDVSAYSKTEIDSKVSTINSAIDGKEASGTAASTVSSHNTNTSAHNDIRLLITDLTTRLNTLANSTDEDLDQMAEIVAYIKSNKSLIDSITTNKVNVADIINNLTTNVTNKPLSAAQGVAIKNLIDALQDEVDANESAISSAQTKLDGIEAGAQVNVNGNWNENNSESDAYIENRPFYTGEPVDTLLVDNVTFETSDYNGLGYARNPFALELIEGTEYVVTWNGTNYTTTCTVMDGLLAIGNGSIFGMGEDTGAPFLIGYSGGIMLYATSAGTVTISIVGRVPEVCKIDSKYIDFPEGSVVGEIYNGVGEIFNDYENNVASGSYSHAEGAHTTASGTWSHAEGYHTTASARWSHAEGYATKASSDAQHVQGKYNIEDAADTYAHIVGNGSSDTRANAHTLDWDGNAWYAGTVKVGGTSYADASEVALKSDISESNLMVDENGDGWIGDNETIEELPRTVVVSETEPTSGSVAVWIQIGDVATTTEETTG